MKKIFLVRHGETDWNKQMRFQGKEDVPLNERGREQARRLARYLRREKIATVFTSPLSRARETAAMIAAEHHLTPQAVGGLTEIHFGHWEGKTYAELDASERAALSRWMSDPALHSIPGGDSLLQYQQRLQNCYRELLDNPAATGNLAVVTHAGAIKVLVAGILEVPLARINRLRLVTASLTVLLYDDWGQPYLELFNAACHLAEMETSSAAQGEKLDKDSRGFTKQTSSAAQGEKLDKDSRGFTKQTSSAAQGEETT